MEEIYQLLEKRAVTNPHNSDTTAMSTGLLAGIIAGGVIGLGIVGYFCLLIWVLIHKLCFQRSSDK